MNLDILQQIADPSLCTAGAIVKDGKILLGMRNYTPDKWKDISVWTTPGGRCDEGETVEIAFRREVKEEVDIDDLTIEGVIAQIPGAKEGDQVVMFYCKTNQDPKLMEPEKFSEWKWVPLEEYFKGDPYDVMNPEAHRLITEYVKSQ